MSLKSTMWKYLTRFEEIETDQHLVGAVFDSIRWELVPRFEGIETLILTF